MVLVVFSVSRVKWSVTFDVEDHRLLSIYPHQASPYFKDFFFAQANLSFTFIFFLRANTVPGEYSIPQNRHLYYFPHNISILHNGQQVIISSSLFSLTKTNTTDQTIPSNLHLLLPLPP